jgi:hypothetical protein
MAQPDIIRGTYFAMGVGDGASPETFPALCGITTRKFTMQGAFGVTKNWRFWYTEPAADLVYQGYWEGPAILTQIEETGGDDAFATISVQIESDGEWTWTEV